VTPHLSGRRRHAHSVRTESGRQIWRSKLGLKERVPYLRAENAFLEFTQSCSGTVRLWLITSEAFLNAGKPFQNAEKTFNMQEAFQYQCRCFQSGRWPVITTAMGGLYSDPFFWAKPSYLAWLHCAPLGPPNRQARSKTLVVTCMCLGRTREHPPGTERFRAKGVSHWPGTSHELPAADEMDLPADAMSCTAIPGTE